MLLAFAPFVAFAILNHFIAPTAALVVAAHVSLGLIVREVSQARPAKILEVGTCILFSCLALYAYLTDAAWPVVGVKLAVDVGLLAIVLFSLVIGCPFTMQYARGKVCPETCEEARNLFTPIASSHSFGLPRLQLS